MKKILCLNAIAVSLLALSACGATSGKGSQANTIAISLNNYQDYFYYSADGGYNELMKRISFIFYFFKSAPMTTPNVTAFKSCNVTFKMDLLSGSKLLTSGSLTLTNSDQVNLTLTYTDTEEMMRYYRPTLSGQVEAVSGTVTL